MFKDMGVVVLIHMSLAKKSVYKQLARHPKVFEAFSTTRKDLRNFKLIAH